MCGDFQGGEFRDDHWGSQFSRQLCIFKSQVIGVRFFTMNENVFVGRRDLELQALDQAQESQRAEEAQEETVVKLRWSRR